MCLVLGTALHERHEQVVKSSEDSNKKYLTSRRHDIGEKVGRTGSISSGEGGGQI